ncbi:MAG: roadblock/LC7 domain-containing protein [Polyangiaceae bacterium]
MNPVSDPSRSGDADGRSREAESPAGGYELGAARALAEARLASLAEVQEENARLRVEVAEIASLRARIDALQAEVARLSAAGYIARSAHEDNVKSGVTACGPQPLVERLGAAAHVRSAVIADEMGFVVASHGELAEVLGAFGTFLADAAARATVNLPVGEVKEVRLRGENDVTICAHRTLGEEGPRLVLTLVEVSPERREDREIQGSLARAAAMLRSP